MTSMVVQYSWYSSGPVKQIVSVATQNRLYKPELYCAGDVGGRSVQTIQFRDLLGKWRQWSPNKVRQARCLFKQ